MVFCNAGKFCRTLPYQNPYFPTRQAYSRLHNSVKIQNFFNVSRAKAPRPNKGDNEDCMPDMVGASYL
jgi:hypothetical protein